MKLSKALSICTNTEGQRADSKWNGAISDTEAELRELARKRSRIVYALRVFRANKRDGIPWPGNKSIKLS